MTTAIRPFVVVDVVEGGPNDGAPLIAIAAEIPAMGRIVIATETPLDAVRLIAELMEAVRAVDPDLFADYFEEVTP